MINEVIFVCVDLFVSTQFSFKPHVREDLINYCKNCGTLCNDFNDFYDCLFRRYLLLDGADSLLCMKLIKHLSNKRWLFS